MATTGPTLRLPEPERHISRAAGASRTLAQVEREHIVATLQATNWVLGGWDGAAARLGLSRTTLISRMQRLGISAGSGLRKSPSQPASLAGCEGPTATTAGRWLIDPGPVPIAVRHRSTPQDRNRRLRAA